ncbi:AAA family ATPase, partial [Kitasatospora sp. NPDC058965]|uniref:AAA family ATPase n=1 Tax=Kitasatospora sp. NPDC058965 TaxID=3346682 RepID=UPI0036864899
MSIAPVRAPHAVHRPLPTGREAAHHRLCQALDAAEAGSGTVLALHGSVGSGRSDLLLRFTDLAAERGATVLLATGSPLEREFPLGLARQLLQSAALDPEQAAAAELLLARGIAESSRGSGPGRLGQPTLEGLFALVRGLAEAGPVLVAVDDRQDADPESLEFLLYLVRRTRGIGVLTVLSSRETMTPPNPFFEVELARQPHHRQLRLDVLSTAVVAELLRERFGAAAAARSAVAAHALTGGNALLVHALLD